VQVSISQDSYNKKYYATIYLYNLAGRSSNYALAFSVYPTNSSASTIVDAWAYNGYSSPEFVGGSYTYSSSSSGGGGRGGWGGSSSSSSTTYTFTEGCDYDCANNVSSDENVISVGSYVERTSFTIYYNGSYYGKSSSGNHTYDLSSYTNSIGDISSFSSYRKPGYGPADQSISIPYITGPGEYTISAFNRYDEADLSGLYTYDDSTYYINFYAPVTEDIETAPYGTMAGTSMSCPVVAGIVALWMQANPTLTLAEIKNIMKETAIVDDYVTGTNADMFGNGKINALAGLNYITVGELDETEESAEPIQELAYKRVIYYPRDFNAGWQTICLPFETTLEELSGYGVSAAYAFTGTTDKGSGKYSLNFDDVTTLSAHTPYLLYLDSSVDQMGGFQFEAAELKALAEASEDDLVEVSDNVNSAFTFVPTYTYYAKNASDNPIVSGDYFVKAAGIKKAAGGNEFHAFRAYLRKESAAASKSFTYSLNGREVTGIEALEIDEAVDGPVYNVAGQRLKKAGKGIHIINGKKVLVK